MVVYFCSGDVVEYPQATACHLLGEWLMLYAGEQVIERFRRNSVYFCCPPSAYPSPICS
jgi:hypothetical protein